MFDHCIFSNGLIFDKIKYSNHSITEFLEWLAHGLKYVVKKYTGILINKCKFNTKQRDYLPINQNSGLKLVAETYQFTSAKDGNPILFDRTYYEIIQEVWKVDFEVFMENGVLMWWGGTQSILDIK